MTEDTAAGPDLFPVGDFAGSGLAEGPLLGGEQSEAHFDEFNMHDSVTGLDGVDDWDDAAVNFAGSVVDDLHVSVLMFITSLWTEHGSPWSRHHS